MSAPDMAKMQQQMEQMRAQMERLHKSTDPVERQKLMQEHMKLMQENIKDPYHPGLLHTWFVTFGLWRAEAIVTGERIRRVVLRREVPIENAFDRPGR